MTDQAAVLARQSTFPLFAMPLVPLWAMLAADGWIGILLSCLFGWWLLSLAILDIRHFILPDALTLPLVPAGFMATWLTSPALLPDAILGAAAGFMSFWLVREGYYRLRNREGLGFGDVKLMAGLGAWLGWQSLASVVLIAALAGLAVMLPVALRRDQTAGLRLPFGAYLALGAWLVWLYGPVTLT
jgi:leader peptidase (prepilin peptidase)/N-methyltransferase